MINKYRVLGLSVYGSNRKICLCDDDNKIIRKVDFNINAISEVLKS